MADLMHKTPIGRWGKARPATVRVVSRTVNVVSHVPTGVTIEVGDVVVTFTAAEFNNLVRAWQSDTRLAYERGGDAPRDPRLAWFDP